MSSNTRMNSRAPFLFIIITVVLDAMGIGLVMPIMPELIREVHNASVADAAFWGGWLISTYAAMQFLCGPLLGNLSDRFGRRPVLIISLIVMGIDYLLMAIAPTLFLLFIARFVSGATGATYSTAAAYLADISEKGKRSASFGLIGAAFGVGFILGPSIGGFLGEFGTRMPFLVAGGLALLNALFGFFILKETLPQGLRRRFEWRRANPFLALLRLKDLQGIGSLMLVVFIFVISGNVYATVWSFYVIERFEWSTLMIGLSLGAYGFCAAVVQVTLLPTLVRRWGEESTATFGIYISMFSLAGIIFIESNFLIFAWMPIVALGAVVGPALQGMMADRVGDDEQGELQGVYASVIAIAAAVSPPILAYIFKLFTQDNTPVYLPAAPFIAAAILCAFSLMVLLLTKNQRQTEKISK